MSSPEDRERLRVARFLRREAEERYHGRDRLLAAEALQRAADLIVANDIE